MIFAVFISLYADLREGSGSALESSPTAISGVLPLVGVFCGC